MILFVVGKRNMVFLEILEVSVFLIYYIYLYRDKSGIYWYNMWENFCYGSGNESGDKGKMCFKF